MTEYGIAELYGKNMRERAAALIAIAHPNHRPALYDVSCAFPALTGEVFVF